MLLCATHFKILISAPYSNSQPYVQQISSTFIIAVSTPCIHRTSTMSQYMLFRSYNVHGVVVPNNLI